MVTASDQLEPAFYVALAELEKRISAFREAEEAAEQCKDKILNGLGNIADRDLRLKVTIHAYWNLPEIPVTPLAELATDLTGKRAQQHFLKLVGSHPSTAKCGSCGQVINAKSRDELNKLALGASEGRVRVCDGCRPSPSLSPSGQREWPLENEPPDELTREVLASHIRHGQPYTVRANAICGGMDVELQPEKIALYLKCPDEGIAAAFDATREEYFEWLRSSGSVHCAGRNASGRRCGNPAIGMTGLGFGKWLDEKDEPSYCFAHSERSNT